MIDLANPLTPSRLNRGLTMWAACPTSTGKPGLWPELVARRHGSLVNHVQSGSRGWNAAQQLDGPGLNEYRFDQSTMYGLMPVPQRNTGNMSACASFFYNAGDVFASAMCGRRTQTGQPDSSWYIHNRTTDGLSIVLLGSNGTDFALTKVGSITANGFYTLGFSYDETSRTITQYLNGKPVASATISGSVGRDPHQTILLGCAEFNGLFQDFNIFSVTSGRIWDRALLASEWSELYADHLSGYRTTLNRVGRVRSRYFLGSAAVPPPPPPPPPPPSPYFELQPRDPDDGWDDSDFSDDFDPRNASVAAFSPAVQIPDVDPADARPTLPYRIDHEEHKKDMTPRERRHGQQVSSLLNNLGRTGAIQGSVDDPYFAYFPADSQSFAPPAPTSLAEAIDRCAALLKTLNGGVGP